MKKDPLLLFPAVFDSKLKLIVLDLLYSYKRLEIEQLISMLDSTRSEALKAIWSLQKSCVILRIDEKDNHSLILTALGYSAWRVKNKIDFWEQTHHYQ